MMPQFLREEVGLRVSANQFVQLYVSQRKVAHGGPRKALQLHSTLDRHAATTYRQGRWLSGKWAYTVYAEFAVSGRLCTVRANARIHL